LLEGLMKEMNEENNEKAGATRALLSILQNLGAGPAIDAAGDDAAPETDASLGDLVEELDERAFGLAMLLFALPSSIPFVYVLPQILSLPMLALAMQMAAGREAPWLPQKMRERRFKPDQLAGVIRRVEPYARWFEALARPRLLGLTGRTGTRIVGAIMMAPIISVLVPLPATNAVPAIGVSIASLGLVERDGLLVVLGLFIGLAWLILLLVFGLSAAAILKDYVLSIF